MSEEIDRLLEKTFELQRRNRKKVEQMNLLLPSDCTAELVNGLELLITCGSEKSFDVVTDTQTIWLHAFRKVETLTIKWSGGSTEISAPMHILLRAAAYEL